MPDGPRADQVSYRPVGYCLALRYGTMKWNGWSLASAFTPVHT